MKTWQTLLREGDPAADAQLSAPDASACGASWWRPRVSRAAPPFPGISRWRWPRWW
jgi:hypothetical protein